MKSNCELLRHAKIDTKYADQLSQFYRFLAGGGLATLIHWSSMATCLALSDMSEQWATSIGAVIGACVNYPLQRRYVFKCLADHVRTLFPYLISVLAVWLINGFVFWVFNGQMHVPTIYAQLAATAAVTVMNFKLQGRVFS